MSVPMLQEISKGVSIENYVRPKKINVLVSDISGSMSWIMRQLANDVMLRIDQLPQGDALLLGVFSSKGWFRWICARELSEKDDYEKCKAVVKEEFYARAMTCFSEILADVPQALKPFLVKFPVVSFVFFSDGVPTTFPLEKEDAAIEVAAKALAPILTSSVILSYGDYSDRRRLAKLAQMLGGEFVATDNVIDIGESFERTARKQTTRRKKVKLQPKTEFAFTLTPDGSVSTIDTKQEEVLVDEQAAVYSWSQQFAKTNQQPTATIDVQYAACLALLNDGRPDDALNFLSIIGDVAMVEALGSALTNAELSRVEQMIREAVTDETKRFIKGKQINCLPKEDAFDLLDCLNLLMSDESCKFYPYHPDFKYKRIGRASKTKDGYPKFKADANTAVSLSEVVGNQSELNLSVRVTIPGTIELPEFATVDGVRLSRDTIGLSAEFTTHIFRNYALISNALPSTTQLPICVGAEVGKSLVEKGLLALLPNEKEIVVLNLANIPVCNRQRGKEATDWQMMADLAYESLRYGSALKVLKAKRDELDPGRESEQSIEYTGDQAKFLAACGVDRKGAYSPPTIDEPATDVLEVRVMEAKIDKGSSVTMKDFQLMLEGKKKLNFVGELMKVGHDLIVNKMPKQKGEALVWLKDKIAEFTKYKRDLDNSLNARRFACALNGSWVKSFKEETAEFLSGPKKDHKVTLSFKTIKKEI